MRTRSQKKIRAAFPLQILLGAGLQEREARLWQAAFEHGPCHISGLAKHTQLHRPAVYQAVKSLTTKELLTTTKEKGRALYQATGITTLQKWRAQHDQDFREYLKTHTHSNQSDLLPADVRVYRGKDLRHVWEDIANRSAKKTVFYRYDGYPAGKNIDGYIPQSYFDGLNTKKLERFVITNQALRKAVYKKRLECASRMLPGAFDPFQQGVSIFIYHDTVAYIDFTQESAYVIKNTALAQYQARLFQFLYKMLPE